MFPQAVACLWWGNIAIDVGPGWSENGIFQMRTLWLGLATLSFVPTGEPGLGQSPTGQGSRVRLFPQPPPLRLQALFFFPITFYNYLTVFSYNIFSSYVFPSPKSSQILPHHPTPAMSCSFSLILKKKQKTKTEKDFSL